MIKHCRVEILVKQYSDLEIGDDFVNLALNISGGNPSIVEQMVLLYKDIRRNGLKHITYKSLETILDARLGILKQEDLPSYRILVAMSVLGSKFYPAMLEHFDNNSEKEFERIIENLVQRGYINQINNLSFKFKSNEIWKNIVSVVKNDDCFYEVLNILYETLSIYKQSSIALLGYIVQKLNNDDQALTVWTLLMKQASYIGDIGLYVITQKQALECQSFCKIKINTYPS